MSVELISIGNEVLQGISVNTNAAFISRHLNLLGFQITRHTVIADDPKLIIEGVKDAFKRVDLVITTGGLGPTCDDLTREALAAFFSSDFHFDKRVADSLTQRFGSELSTLQDQATIPTKAQALLNDVGTAPGLIFSEKGKTLIALPGVPLEMESLFEKQAIPFLKKHFSLQKVFEETLYLFLLKESDVDLFLRQLEKKYPELAIGIYPSYGTLTVRLASKEKSVFEQAVAEFKKRYSQNLFPSQTGKIEEAIHEIFISKGKTLALAESCTGGSMAARLTALPGASNYFLGSIVAYSDRLKERLLDVSPATLKKQGAVSEETVKEMLHGLLEKSKADFGAAVSGIAGPSGGSKEKPVGTICAAVGARGKEANLFTFKSPVTSRAGIIVYSSNKIFSDIWRQMQHL